jgi:hypothetical protein
VSERGKNVALTAAALGLALLMCELSLRAWLGVPLLDFPNFRDRDPFKVKDTVRYDAELGWALKENFNRADLHTLAYGIRRNGPAQSGLRPGHGLAIGASITEGFALNDDQSWPAQLEALTGEPVDNAAVIGYGLDQMVLRAEALLPVEQPRLLLLGIGTPNIEWMQSTVVRGASKPFFSVADGTLIIRNVPVPPLDAGPLEQIKEALGYSALIDFGMSRLGPGAWYPPITRDNRGSADPVDVSCRLLRRLKGELDARDARALFVVEPQWQEVVPPQASTRELDAVQQCARQAGIGIVDALAAMRAEHLADALSVAHYWEMGQQRHLSEAGSRRLAELVAAALASSDRQSEAH